MAYSCKRKHVTLTLLEKRQILEKLDTGIANNDILKDYNIGRSTLFYIKKNKKEILNAASVFESKRQTRRRTLHGPRQIEFDKILHEWFVSKRNEGITLSGPMLVAKAKSLKQELNITRDMKFSQGWLRSFKSRHGIHQSKIEACDQPSNNVNGQEHLSDEISWDNAEKSMETVIKFLERNPYFNDSYALQAMSLRKDMIVKRLQHEKIVEFHDQLSNTFISPESLVNENEQIK